MLDDMLTKVQPFTMGVVASQIRSVLFALGLYSQVREQAQSCLLRLVDVKKPVRVPLVGVWSPDLRQAAQHQSSGCMLSPNTNTYRLYAPMRMSMGVPSLTGMDEICSPDRVVMGKANGITSSRPAVLRSIQTMGCSLIDS